MAEPSIKDEEKEQSVAMPNKATRERIWSIVILALLGLLLGIWFWLSPEGFWGKFQALGYSVCHQITERSFIVNGLQSPLCSRCAGMYLGALVTLGFHYAWGRQGKFPPLWVLVILGSLLLFFALDGINSALGSFPIYPQLYKSSNLMRLITGLGVGLGIGSLLSPIFNQTVWADWQASSPFERWYRFPILLIALTVLGVAIHSQKPAIFYPANILMGLSILLILWLIHSTLAVFFLRKSNQFHKWREFLLPGLLGLLMVFVQIGVLSLVRYLLTGTWAPFPHGLLF